MFFMFSVISGLPWPPCRSGCLLCVSWVLLDPPGCILGASWVPSGCLLGAPWVSPGCFLGGSGCRLGAFWTLILDHSWLIDWLIGGCMDHKEDSTARTPKPGFQSQYSIARISQPGLHTQDFKAGAPQQGFHSRDSTVRFPNSGFPSWDILKNDCLGSYAWVIFI